MYCFNVSRISFLAFAFVLISGCGDSQSTAEKAEQPKQAVDSQMSKTVAVDSPKTALPKPETPTSVPTVSAASPAESQPPASLSADSALEDSTAVEARSSANKTSADQPTETNETPHQPVAPNKAEIQDKSEGETPTATSPSTVAEVMSALDVGNFPTPKGAEQVSVFGASLHYKTDADLDHAHVTVQDELLKRGFTAGESLRTQNASITVLIDDKPGTIFLMSSLTGNATHVTFHHRQGLDGSQVPTLRATGEIDRRVDQVSYITPIGVLEGQSLLRSKIEAENISIARMSHGNGIVQEFFKDEMRWVASVEETQDMEFEMPDRGQSKYTRISIASSASFDSSKLPTPGEIEKTAQPYNSIFGHYRYVTSANAADAVKACRTELQKAGWQPVEPLRPSIGDRQALLMWNGSLIRVVATEYKNGRTHIDYYSSLMPFDLPSGIETRLVRVDTASPRMFFVASAPPSKIAEFYATHMPAVGWKPDNAFRLEESNLHKQLFRGSHYQPVLLEIENKDPATTWVELRPIDFGALTAAFDKAEESETPINENKAPENSVATAEPDAGAESVDSQPDTSAAMPADIEKEMRKQLEEALKEMPEGIANEARKQFESTLKAALAENQDSHATENLDETTETDTPMEEENVTQPHAVVPADKIAAKDFPIPAGVANVTRDFEMITFKSENVEKNAKSLIDSLTELGWKRRGDQIVDKDMAMLRFQKGTGTINISLILDDRNDPPVHAVIQGDGLWFPESAEFAGEPAEGFEEDMEGFEGDAGGFDEDMNEFDASDEDLFKKPTEFEGLSLPKDIDSLVKMGSQFRTELVTSAESDLKTLHDFFVEKAKESNWKIKSNVYTENQNSVLTLTNDKGEMLVDLHKYEGEVEIKLAFRNPTLAKEHGFLPPDGKARIILANASEVEATITVNKKEYKLAPGQGAEKPDEGIILDVAPGTYRYTIKGSGREEQSDKLKVVIGGSWGLVVFPRQGHMAEQIY